MCGVFNMACNSASRRRGVHFFWFKARPQVSARVCKRRWTLLPHPTQPKPDPISVRVFASEDERYYPTPPHPTKARPHLSACVCKRRWTLLPHPTPSHPTKARPQVSACVCRRRWTLLPHPTPPNQSLTPAQCTQPKPDPISVRAFASEDERYYPTPPHPTKARPHLSACVCKRRWTLLPHPTPSHPTKARPQLSACVCKRRWTLLPHLTPSHPTKARPQLSACVCKRRWTLLPNPAPPHPRNSCACARETKNACSGEACLRVRTWAKKRVLRWGPDLFVLAVSWSHINVHSVFARWCVIVCQKLYCQSDARKYDVKVSIDWTSIKRSSLVFLWKMIAMTLRTLLICTIFPDTFHSMEPNVYQVACTPNQESSNQGEEYMKILVDIVCW